MKNCKEILNDIRAFIFDVDGVLTNGTISLFPDGNMVRHMFVKDGYALQLAQRKGYHLCIITGGIDHMVYKRLRKLGIRDIYSGVRDKKSVFQTHCRIRKIKTEHILYMGDDLPDIEVMKNVGLACAPKDAALEIKEIAKYISPKKGGKGCVRDVIEQTLKAQERWMEKDDEKGMQSM
ncbi:KdsC family phosphatase [Bacteroidetes bacterium endosymbiont of Geopemphigus sp.]|uniref:KdsC family phosphatase n=1 Tax=Bacteroidetes bacterium endosymbiont of Geopemphigus sp. TaxID=2047937 RepID=UPI000CD304BE|nr:HAD hydrolase family protein [Bacteroidetes bacterium endosymbiont of Geopemphigus sp.]